MTEQTLSIFDLRDIVVPEPVGFWPLAAGVWVLVGVACIGLALLIWRGYAVWKSGAYRRAGLARLAQIEVQLETTGRGDVVLHELAILLKRVALAAFPRKQVAPLYGDNWLRFLENTCKSCKFVISPGHLLATAINAGPKDASINADDCNQLFNLVRIWIKNHRKPKTDT